MEHGKRKYIGQEDEEMGKLLKKALFVAIAIAVVYIAIMASIGFIKYYEF